MKKYYQLTLVLIFMSSIIFSQGLFESVQEETISNSTYEMNGYLRTNIFSDINYQEINQYYSELSLILKVDKNKFGQAYAELRIQNNENHFEYNLREAYIDYFNGPLDFRIGQQINVWGRADGYNPTDNLTPQNINIFSPDDDDRRMSNFMFKCTANYNKYQLTGILVPIYRSSEMPLTLIPDNIQFEYDLSNVNSSKALKLNYSGSNFGGSISYFTGYSINPGIKMVNMSENSYELNFIPFPINVIGGDFSSTLFNNIGIRGEIAYKQTQDYDEIFIPSPELEYVLGFDKEIFADINLILQYSGKKIFEYQPSDPSQPLLNQNNIMSLQTEEILHSILFQSGWNLFHSTLNLEFIGNYNFSTSESFYRLKADYNITDAYTFTGGINYYHGDEQTLFGILDDYLNTAYLEMKISF